MKYEKMSAEIIEFGENEFMAGSYEDGECYDYTHSGRYATHSCGHVTHRYGDSYHCEGHYCSGYVCLFYSTCASDNFTCWGYA